jgi:hypothetical protein
MPGNVRQLDVRIVSLPAVPVAAANAARHDLQHDTVSVGYWVRYPLDFGRGGKGSVYDSFHLSRRSERPVSSRSYDGGFFSGLVGKRRQ